MPDITKLFLPNNDYDVRNIDAAEFEWHDINEDVFSVHGLYKHVAIQICGKFKGTMSFAAGTAKDDAIAAVKNDERFTKMLEGKTVIKEIFVPDKLINIVVK